MTTLFFDYPRALVMLLLLVAVGGMAAFLTMPQQEDPKIRTRNAVVLTAFPGASAERVERLVSQRIEDRLREVEEIDNISSTSSTGLSSVQIQLHDRIVETEQAFSIVRDAVSDVIPLLPQGAATPQFIDNRNYAFTLITALVWSADSPPNELILKRSAEELQARLRNVPGTEYTNIQGTSPEEISVSVRADLAQSLGLSEQDVALALAAADAKISAGQIFGPANEIAVEVRGGFNNLDRIRNVPLRRGPDGAQVLVGDVATVSRGLQEPSSEAAYIDSRPAVVVGTRIDDGLRVGLWSERVREELRAFEAELSSGIELQLIFDQSVYARKRFVTLLQNLAVGISLVTVILFFTLGPRAACLVTLAIPLTTFLSLAVMNLFGIPIHQMSITGLIVALGLLVDAAIVTVDAIGRALKKGVDARQAVSESVRRLLIPLSSSTATTVLAFMPITLLPGSAGEFVGPIADSVIIALIASLFLALTAIAALAGRFLKPSVGDTTKSSGGLDIPGLGNGFRYLLDRSLAAPRVSIAVSLVLPVLGFLGVTTLPSQFFPAADRTQFHVQLVLPPQSSLAATEEAAQQADSYLEAHDEIESAQWFVGSSAPSFYYNLVAGRDGSRQFAEAMVTTFELGGLGELINSLQQELSSRLPNVEVRVREISQGPPTPAPFELRIRGRDLDTLRLIGEKARLVLSEMPEVTVSSASLSGGEPKLWLNADEEAARLAGFTLKGLADDLSAKYQGARGGSVLEGQSSVPVVVRLDDVDRGSISQLASTTFNVPGSANVGAPLLGIGNITLEPAAATITRYNGERINTILAFIRSGALPSTVVEKFNATIEQGQFDLPPGYTFEYGGDAEARSDAVGNLLASVGLIVTSIIAVVVLTFGSFRLGAVVLVVAGLSIGLGMLSLVIGGYPFGFQPIVALMGLMGVAINAAIIIIATLKAIPQAVAGDRFAIRDGVMETSRHITSTTVTTFAGFLPLILTEGDFWPPFATSIAGGVVLSTIISFFFVPQMFLLLTRSRPVASIDRGPEGLEAQYAVA